MTSYLAHLSRRRVNCIAASNMESAKHPVSTKQFVEYEKLFTAFYNVSLSVSSDSSDWAWGNPAQQRNLALSQRISALGALFPHKYCSHFLARCCRSWHCRWLSLWLRLTSRQRPGFTFFVRLHSAFFFLLLMLSSWISLWSVKVGLWESELTKNW